VRCGEKISDGERNADFAWSDGSRFREWRAKVRFSFSALLHLRKVRWGSVFMNLTVLRRRLKLGKDHMNELPPPDPSLLSK
jgi:hypothetical protein